jgi:hypothetical protein
MLGGIGFCLPGVPFELQTSPSPVRYHRRVGAPVRNPEPESTSRLGGCPYSSSAGLIAGVIQVNAQLSLDVPVGPAIPTTLTVGPWESPEKQPSRSALRSDRSDRSVTSTDLQPRLAGQSSAEKRGKNVIGSISGV